MLSRIKRELAFLIENAAVLGLGAFLCCAGGILLAFSLGLIGMNVVVTKRTFFTLRLFQFMSFAVELLFLCGKFMDLL